MSCGWVPADLRLVSAGQAMPVWSVRDVVRPLRVPDFKLPFDAGCPTVDSRSRAAHETAEVGHSIVSAPTGGGHCDLRGRTGQLRYAGHRPRVDHAGADA